MNLFPVFISTSGISVIINYAIGIRSYAIRPNMQNTGLKRCNKLNQNRTRRSGEIEKSLRGEILPPPPLLLTGAKKTWVYEG
jgi:hypothetical protein